MFTVYPLFILFIGMKLSNIWSYILRFPSFWKRFYTLTLSTMFHQKNCLWEPFSFIMNSSGNDRISPLGLILLATASREKENLFLKSEYFYFSFLKCSLVEPVLCGALEWMRLSVPCLWAPAYVFSTAFIRQEMVLLLTYLTRQAPARETNVMF